MTEKEFLDVFPHLKVDAELEALLGAVKVMKVAVNPQKDCLRVYIMSSQWIHKKHIYHLEEAIREQFFENANLRVKIIEKFRLSRQYTPENFMEVYRPSILLELKRYSMLEYNLFATADISFPEPETMELVMTDSVIAREKEGELIRLLEKIFCERCGFNLRVHPSFREAAESKVHKNSELRILEEARQILARSKVGRKAGFSGIFRKKAPRFRRECQARTAWRTPPLAWEIRRCRFWRISPEETRGWASRDFRHRGPVIRRKLRRAGLPRRPRAPGRALPARQEIPRRMSAQKARAVIKMAAAISRRAAENSSRGVTAMAPGR